jgi:hypothetical protein
MYYVSTVPHSERDTDQNFLPKITWMSAPTHPAFLFPQLKFQLKRSPFWHNWGAWGRIAGGAEQCHRTRLPGCIYKMAEALVTVHMRRRRLRRGWWPPVGPKLVFWPDGSTSPENHGWSLYIPSLMLDTKFHIHTKPLQIIALYILIFKF